MKGMTHTPGEGSLSTTPGNNIEVRLMRSMATAVALAIIVSLPFAQWRFISGLLLGGILSLLNHYWMRTSIAAAFDSALGRGVQPRLRLAGYVLRYFVIFGVVFLAYQLNIVSLPATIAGLSSFVVALFVEASREIYFAIIHREEVG